MEGSFGEALRRWIRGQPTIPLVGLVLVAYHLAFIATPAPAVDLGFRVTESRYLLAGIDPFLVMSGKVPPIAGLGGANGYSFVSYILILPLTLLDTHVAREIAFVALEVSLVVVSLHLVGGFLGGTSRRMLVAVMVALLGSVFFLQHALNLNYAIIGASATVMALTANWYGRPWQGILGLILVGVKPSFAIPVVLVLLVRREWRVLLPAGAILGGLLVAVSFQLGRNPVDVLLSAASTADYWSTGYENGILAPVWALVAPVAVPLGIIASAGTVVLLRRRLADPVVALAVTFALGIGLFYNHVHAWTAVFPLVLVAAAWSDRSRDARWALVLLMGFMLVPRLVGAIPVEHRDLYIAVHNLVRFGVLFAGVALIVRAAPGLTRPPTLGDQATSAARPT